MKIEFVISTWLFNGLQISQVKRGEKVIKEFKSKKMVAIYRANNWLYKHYQHLI